MSFTNVVCTPVIGEPAKLSLLVTSASERLKCQEHRLLTYGTSAEELMISKKSIYMSVTWRILFIFAVFYGMFIFFIEVMSWELYVSLIAVIPALLTSIAATLASIPLMSGKYKSLNQFLQTIKMTPELYMGYKKFLLKGSLTHFLMFLGIALGIFFINEKRWSVGMLLLAIGIIGAVLFFSQAKKLSDFNI